MKKMKIILPGALLVFSLCMLTACGNNDKNRASDETDLGIENDMTTDELVPDGDMNSTVDPTGDPIVDPTDPLLDDENENGNKDNKNNQNNKNNNQDANENNTKDDKVNDSTNDTGDDNVSGELGNAVKDIGDRKSVV